MVNERNDSDNYYIGLNRASNSFKWIDNSDIHFANWKPEEADPSRGYNCVEFIRSSGQWKTIDCLTKRIPICQKSQIFSYYDSVLKQKCTQNDYFRYNDNCYRLYNQNEAKSHNEAELKCQTDNENSHLISIMDSNEWEVIKY